MKELERLEFYRQKALRRIDWLLWTMDLPWYKRLPIVWGDRITWWLMSPLRWLGWDRP